MQMPFHACSTTSLSNAVGASFDATPLPAGQAVTESYLAATLADIQARVAELSIQQNQASQTAQKLGAVGLLVLSSRQKFMHAP